MPVWVKYAEICTRSSFVTSAVIVNYSLISINIIWAISIDIAQVFAFTSPIDNVVAGVFMLAVVWVLSLFNLRGIAVSLSTSAFSVCEGL